MFYYYLALAAALLLAAPSFAADAAPTADPPAPAADTPAFSAELYAQLAPTAGNLFFSPTSIETALAMTYAGAKGPTAEQMAKTLHYNVPAEKLSAAFAKLIDTLNRPPMVENWQPDGENVKTVKTPAYQLVVANALWGQQGFPFQPDFTQLLKTNYQAELNTLNFADAEKSRTVINTWVATQTKSKIKDLIGSGVLNADTRLVLTNAVYFKSDWAHKFQAAATKAGPFKLSADKSVNVSLMHQKHDFGYMETADLQLLELPYNQGALSMVILLPKNVGDLPALEKKFTADNLAAWLKQAKSESVQVTLPKFTFSAELQLAATLKAMGMPDAFDAGKADFSGMTSAQKLFISAIIHKAFVAVDEEGTEAAAATAIAMAGAAMPVPTKPKIFRADHPFLFLIRHPATNEILFLGRLTNPKAE